MPKVHCKRPNAPLNINGHEFVPHPDGGTVSAKELSDADAEALIEVGGYELVGEVKKPAATPAPTSAPAPAAPPKLSHGMNAAQIKAELGRRNVTIPAECNTKPELAALLDAQPAVAPAPATTEAAAPAADAAGATDSKPAEGAEGAGAGEAGGEGASA
jgi:hypothetical protein